jgi:hypothetical protein
VGSGDAAVVRAASPLFRQSLSQALALSPRCVERLARFPRCRLGCGCARLQFPDLLLGGASGLLALASFVGLPFRFAFRGAPFFCLLLRGRAPFRVAPAGVRRLALA